MPFGLYVHFPFCRNTCSYCDFYKEKHQAALEREFYHALRIETELAAEHPAVQRSQVTTIFIGGGTPNISDPDLLTDWLGHLRRHIDVADEIEFTIECNPEAVTREQLERLKGLGVNRPVFGVQSFNTRLLKLLDRRHHPHDSYRAIYYANALGFRAWGVDFIFGLPGQTSKMLAADLDQLLDFEPPHVSYYQLTVEEGTPLWRRVKAGKLRMPDQELLLALYRGGVEQMADLGYLRYEVSSFARPGFECRHNLGYWEGAEYLGLGPSAHSYLDNTRFANWPNVREYIKALQAGILPRTVDESGAPERMTEAIMLGLRTARGISRSAFAERFGQPIESRLDTEQYALLVESGHLIPERGMLRLSEEGIHLADEITRRLLK
ncbi:MAG TPA: radical SAM family heme chaperone HemW [candidate division Zixibacteria bacterium]|nr:radical SAM family heme chaperone HemW [candidate division Zixibacteria bacterium]MDD4916646.1 radical SAM family heme chaperone HemW [candidate division Zixibacteria bacterium]MDM7973204.1 radical SAM family heme chaperone HemW [candidate division Zixibacteria bacterium]HOD67063.1 radical SAM family heme chaperone HemW [candidate division Zixibacteria bacterium]HPC11440.1 radical SAM family heme chaperone HemW [candidate division Zixibacteria bacterium]